MNFGYSRLEYSGFFPSGGAFGRFCGSFSGEFANLLQIACLLCRRGKGILGGVGWFGCLIRLIHFAEKKIFRKVSKKQECIGCVYRTEPGKPVFRLVYVLVLFDIARKAGSFFFASYPLMLEHLVPSGVHFELGLELFLREVLYFTPIDDWAVD